MHMFEFEPSMNSIELVGTFTKHANSVRNVQVSPNCNYVLSSSEDHTLKLWEYQTFKPLTIFYGHRDIVSGAAFLNNNTFVSSSWDLKIMIWKF